MSCMNKPDARPACLRLPVEQVYISSKHLPPTDSFNLCSDTCNYTSGAKHKIPRAQPFHPVTPHPKWGAALCLVAQPCLTLCNPMDCSLPGSSVHEDSPGKNTGVSCHALLQGSSHPGIEPRSPASLPHCGQVLYHLSHHGSPRILEWVVYPFSRGSSQPRS